MSETPPPSWDEATPPQPGPREWFGARAESLLGTIANELLGSTTMSGALSRVFEARGKATEAQQAAMTFLNLPTAADLERLTRRVRSVAQRLEAVEDALARIEADVRRDLAPIADRLESIEGEFATSSRLLHEIHAARHPAQAPPPAQPPANGF